MRSAAEVIVQSVDRAAVKIVQTLVPAHLRYWRVIGVVVGEDAGGYAVQVYGPCTQYAGVALIRTDGA